MVISDFPDRKCERTGQNQCSDLSLALRQQKF